MARHRKPTWRQRNSASLSASTMLLLIVSCIAQILSGASPFSLATAADTTPVKVVVSNVDTRPSTMFETRRLTTTPVVNVEVQPTAQQPPVVSPASIVVAYGSNLSQEAAKLGGDWTWQKLCALTNPAIKDCNIVPAGMVIVLNGPTHALPAAPAPAPVLKVVPAAHAAVVAPAPAPVPVQHTAPVAPSVSTTNMSHQQLMTAAGIAPSDFGYVEFIISHESGWRPTVQNPNGSAYGLPQALPGSKMASMGSDWRTNPVTQLRWANWYAHSAYGSWANAYAHWVSHRWW